MDKFDSKKLLRGALAGFVFLLVLAMLPFTPKPAIDVKVLLYHWAALLLWMGLWMQSLSGKQSFRLPRLIFWPFLIFLSLNAVAAVFSGHVANSTAEVSRLLSLFALFLAASQLYSTFAQVRTLLIVYCSAVTLASLYACGQRFGIDPFPWDAASLSQEQYTNLPGTFGNPNLAGHALALAIIAAVYLSFQPGKRWCLGFAGISLIHMVMTRHRAGLVALCAAAFLAGVIYIVRKRGGSPSKALRVCLGTLCATCAGGAVLVMASAMVTRGHATPLDASALLRYNSYYDASSMITDKPILGFGPGNYRRTNPPYWTAYEQRNYARKRIVNEHVHNELLQAAVDSGILAAIAYVLLFVSGLVAGLRMAFVKRHEGEWHSGVFYAAIFLAFPVDGLFGFNLHAPVSAVLLVVLAGSLAGRDLPKRATNAAPRHPILALAACTALLLVLVMNTAFGTRVFGSELTLQRGIGAMYWEHFPEADVLFERGERMAPWNWRFGYQRGLVQRALGNKEAAIRHFNRGLAQHPYSLPLLIRLTQSHFDQAVASRGADSLRSIEAARHHAELAIVACSKLPEPQDTLGRIALLAAARTPDSRSLVKEIQTDIAQARYHLRRALAFGASQRNELFRLLAGAEVLQGDNDAAQADYLRAIQAAPLSDVTWSEFYSFAAISQRLAIFEIEIESRIDLLSMQPDDWDRCAPDLYIWWARSRRLSDAGADGAFATYEEVLEWFPKNTSVWAHFGQFAIGAEADRLEGRETAEQDIEDTQAPEPIPARTILERFRQRLLETYARILEQGERPPPAMAAVARIWEPGPDALAEAVDLLARALLEYEQNRPQDRSAIELDWALHFIRSEVEEMEQLSREEAGALVTLGSILARLDHLEEADHVLARAIPLTEGETGARAVGQRVEVLAELKRLDEAEQLLRKHYSSYERAAGYRIAFARILSQNGKPNQARFEYTTLLASFRFDPETRQEIERELAELQED